MARLIGQFVGGSLVVFLLSMLLEWLIFKRVVDSPKVGIPASVAAAVLLAIILYGFGNANGGPWNPGPGLFIYPLAGIAVFIFRMVTRKDTSQDDLTDTFE